MALFGPSMRQHSAPLCRMHPLSPRAVPHLSSSSDVELILDAGHASAATGWSSRSTMPRASTLKAKRSTWQQRSVSCTSTAIPAVYASLRAHCHYWDSCLWSHQVHRAALPCVHIRMRVWFGVRRFAACLPACVRGEPFLTSVGVRCNALYAVDVGGGWCGAATLIDQVLLRLLSYRVPVCQQMYTFGNYQQQIDLCTLEHSTLRQLDHANIVKVGVCTVPFSNASGTASD